MKTLVILMSMILTVAAKADDNPLAGQYSDCVRWTTMMGLETSKKFELAFGVDSSLHLVASYYEGTASCDGSPKEVRSYSDFAVVENKGGRRFRMITAKSETANLYFKFILSPESAEIYTSETLPVKLDVLRAMLLKRVQ